MKRVALIACCGQKAPGPAPARELYRSDLFRKSVAYAEAHGMEWFVLSALHGVLIPGEVISSYNVRLEELGVDGRVRWNRQVMDELRGHGVDIRSSGISIEVLAGELYAKPFRMALRAREAGRWEGAEILFPLEGLGIGKRLAWLKSRAAF